MPRTRELEEKNIILSNFNKVLSKKNKNLQEQADRYSKIVKKLKSRTNKALRQLEKGKVEDAIDTLKGEYQEYRKRK